MILGIVQARVSSSRLPGKVLKPIMGRPMLALELERVLRSRRMDKVIVATSTNPEDAQIEVLSRAMGVTCFRGSLNDVLDRFYQAAKLFMPEHVVRLTGDCPLIDSEIIDATIDFYCKGAYDYVSNCQPPYTFPDGLDTEVFRFSALETAWKEALLPSHKEHVTPFMKQRPDRFKIGHYTRSPALGHFRLTVDEPEDLKLVTMLYEALYPIKPGFVLQDVLDYLEQQPELQGMNAHIGRNVGSKKSLVEDKKFIAQLHNTKYVKD